MKNTFRLIILVSVLFAGCEREKSFQKEKGPGSITEFFEANSAPAQEFPVVASSGGTVQTTAGLKIFFPSDAFQTKAGVRVTGKVSVDVKEILTPGEMILNSMPTTSGDRVLESGGEFHLKVTQNQQELSIVPGKFVRITIPNSNRADMNGMQVFNGVDNGQGGVDWVLNTNPGNVVVGDSMLFAGSNLFTGDIGWLNCDKFINEPTVSLTVMPANAPSNDSTNVFVHLTGRNSIVKMDWKRGLPYFTTEKALAVPSTIIGVSVKNGQLYASFVPVTVQDGVSLTLNFQPYTEKTFKEKLTQLR